MRSVLAVCALGAGACLSTPPAQGSGDAPIGCRDGDGDGWPAAGEGCGTYVDCDDGNDERYPGAREADDGVSDLDCNGATLTDAVDVEDLDYSSLPGSGVSVVARMLDLEFGMEASYQLSSLRTTNGVNGELLFTGAMAEKWSGVNLWQAYYSTVASGTPTAQAMGPAVFRWHVPFTTQGLQGTSLYTVTIDGRIYRSDGFEIGMDPAGANHSVTAYVALDATKFVDVTAQGQTTPMTIGADPFRTYFEPFANAATWLCARTPEQDVVWAQAGTSGPNTTTAGPRITSGVDTWGEQVALQYDWQFNIDPVAVGVHGGHFLLAPTFRAATEACSVGAALARGFQAPALAEVTAPGQLVLDDAGDIGVKDGFVEAGGYYLVDAGAGPGLRVQIDAEGQRQAPVASTWRVRGIPATPPPVVTRDGVPLVHGLDYRVQADGADGLWLVVTTTLMNNQMLRLVVPRQTVM